MICEIAEPRSVAAKAGRDEDERPVWLVLPYAKAPVMPAYSAAVHGLSGHFLLNAAVRAGVAPLLRLMSRIRGVGHTPNIEQGISGVRNVIGCDGPRMYSGCASASC